MNLRARLWRVLKARLTTGRDVGRDAGESRKTSRRPPNSSSSSSSPPPSSSSPAVDPELARWYANLELPYGADADAVERAWKKLARRYHPDLHANDPERQEIATEVMKELQTAYLGLRSRLGKNVA